MEVLKNPVLPLVNDGFRAAYGDIEFLRKPFEGDAIEQATRKDGPVTFRIWADDPFIDQQFDIAAAKVGRDHFLTLPVPLHVGHCFS